MMIDTIVFDFGGVLIDWNPRHYYKDVFKDDDKMNWFLDNVCTTEWNTEQDRGRPFAEGIKILKNEFSGYDELIHAFWDNWDQMLGGEISGTVRLLNILRKKYKIYGLTNWSSETFPVAFERFDFLHSFDGILVSGDEKLIKPDERFFHLLLDKYHLKAENCIFIDDNSDNICAAKKIGFNSIHFQNPEDLEGQLKLLNVIS